MTKSLRNCPDCAVAPGTPHEVNCDVARCLCCGFQALFHGYPADPEADPDTYEGVWLCENTDEPIPEVWQTWTGEWPGVEECRELGWYSRWTIATEYSRDGRPDSGPSLPCDPDHPHAHEDLNRLVQALCSGELVWSRERQRAVLPG